MSVEAMSWVFRDSQETVPGRRLVLLALADHAGHDGAGAYPSVATLASKTKLSERAVQYALRALQESGQIERTGKGPKGTIEYRLVMEGGCNDCTPEMVAGVQGVAPEPSLGVVVTSLASSSETSNTSSTKAAVAGARAREVDRIFGEWKRVMGKNGRTILTKERRRKIEQRLKTFSPDELVETAEIAARDPFYMGDNDSGTPYNDITTIYRDDTQVAKFLERKDAPLRPVRNGRTDFAGMAARLREQGL